LSIQLADPTRSFIEIASDNFNRANETPLGGNWSNGNHPFVLTSNSITFDVSTNDCLSFYNTTFANDQWAKAKLTVNGTSGTHVGIGFALRASFSGTDTLYRVVVDHASSVNVGISKIVAGSFTALKTFTVTPWADGEEWIATVKGSGALTLISVYRGLNWIGSAFDTAGSISSGKAGVCYSSNETSASIDDWSGGNLVLATDRPYRSQI